MAISQTREHSADFCLLYSDSWINTSPTGTGFILSSETNENHS
jgi:hypothetical protein